MENILNVLHIFSSFTVGGAEKLFLELASVAGEEPELKLSAVVMNNRTDDYMRSELVKILPDTAFFDRPQGRKHPSYFFMLRKIVKEKGIMAVHTHSFGGKFWAIGLKLFCPGLKLYYTVHATTEVTAYSKLNLWFHKRFVDRSIAISQAVYDECMQVGLSKTTLVYNGIPITRFTGCIKDFTKRPLTLVNLSRIVPEIKGQDLIIRAIAVCVKKGLDLRLMLGGDIEGSYRKSYEMLYKLAADEGIADRVSFDGYIKDTASYLSRAELYVSASVFEGLGLSLIEAMAGGLCVVTADAGGPVELVENGKCGLIFKSGDIDGLADHIERLYCNPAEAAELSEKSRERSRTFDICNMLSGYMKIYRGRE